MQSDDLGLASLLRSRIGVEFDGEAHLTEAEAQSVAAAIERLVAERDEAREALKPFAEFGGAWTKQSETDNSPFATAADDQQLRIGASLVSFTVGDFRRARKALGEP